MRPTRVVAGLLIALLAVVASSFLLSARNRFHAPMGGSTVASVMTSTSRQVVESITPSMEPVLLELVRHGLSAWGRFAVTRDMREVDPWFAHDGPQYARFLEEASRPEVDGIVYSVDIENSQVEVSGSRAWVKGRVTFARTTEGSFSYDWTIHLRRREATWLIWTVTG